ncbi:hypothetical protein Taro_019617 [Colocasia esculenta]|uniref:EF-hand domain-containing protein n=1 Tax=Colocasia esculenta TaxID=4460 RepID=A0A843UU02_COLES|nr:hypothetical protein [Colocasia esculenta]
MATPTINVGPPLPPAPTTPSPRPPQPYRPRAPSSSVAMPPASTSSVALLPPLRPSPTTLTELFCLFDQDNDDKITKQELEIVQHRLEKSDPLMKEEVAMMLVEVDQDDDGCISLEDFEALG